jgi:menaquinone-specific isochorismate synthase
MVGVGNVVRIDPGTGARRYQRALDALRSSGRQVGMASFTFDPDEPGSIVEIPETFDDSVQFDHETSTTPEAKTIDTGEEPWRSGIEAALQAVHIGAVEKVVVTRQVDLEMSTPVSIAGLTRRLHTDQPESFTFHVAGLVGASPELLVSLLDSRVSSLALAGTATETEGLITEKMDREHQLSRSSVEEAISPHVQTLTVQDRTIRRFGDIRHLATQFEGEAAPGVTALDILGSLHPTAAVAGTPSEAALRAIRKIEPRTRGRYAGPVGWFDTEGDGEFAIALRCGFIKENKVTLFAGGGIVEGSEKGAEWRETELKLQPMRRALGLE